MGEPVVHFEIGATDWARTRDFYAELFGWTVTGSPSGYGMIDTGSGLGIGGGIMQAPPGRPPWFAVYVAVDDVEKALARAEELGGTRVVEPRTVEGGEGCFAMFADPDGTLIGLFQKPE
jgi:predicted enzyme related to lactoylglutathione lyase